MTPQPKPNPIRAAVIEEMDCELNALNYLRYLLGIARTQRGAEPMREWWDREVTSVDARIESAREALAKERGGE